MELDRFCMGCMEERGQRERCSRCGWVEGAAPLSPQHLPARTLLTGKYLLGRVLGQGGFGITYLAWDLNLGLKLAVKEYLPLEYASRAPGRGAVTAYSAASESLFHYGLEQFLAEAKTLAQFEGHPGIVSVRDFFRTNGTAYLVMSYLKGLTLKEYLARAGGKIPFNQALGILMPVLDALKEVHGKGVLHRDISPDNIFITAAGRVVVIDFGAARQAVGDRSRSLSVVLKPGYTPEEQYRSKGIQGPWTDIYALAATFYRAVSGAMPPESLDRLAEDNLVPLSRLGAAIGREEERVLLKAMAVRARDRYQSVREFQEALIGRGALDQAPQEGRLPAQQPPAQTPATDHVPPPVHPTPAPQPVQPAPTPVPGAPPADTAASRAAPAPMPAGSKLRDALTLSGLMALLLALTGFLIFYQYQADRTLRAAAAPANNGLPYYLFAADFEAGVFPEWEVWIDWPTSIDPGWGLREEGGGYCLEGRGHAFVHPPVMGWSDYTVMFRFNLLEGGFHFNIRQYHDHGHFRYFVGVGEGLNLVKETPRVSPDGASESDFHELAHVESNIRLDRWYTLEVSVEGSMIKVYLDHELVIDYLDDQNPILSGVFSFESHDDTVVLIDDIIAIREVITAAGEVIPEQERIYIPTLDATVRALRFFESDEDVLPFERRSYGGRFSRETARFICWELYLVYPEPGRMIDFALYAEYYNAGGEMIHAGRVDGLWIESGWTESLHASGVGHRLPGSWEPGEYRVHLFLDDEQIAEGVFEIDYTEESESETEDKVDR